MRNNYKSVLFIFILLIVFAGLGLLFLRQPFVDYLRRTTGISEIDVPTRKSPSASVLIDTKILEDGRLNSLKDNVSVFDFEEICGKSVNTNKRCAEGNNNPFK